MKLYELHNELSTVIGDAVFCTETSIPDGPRISKELRDSYLYRAMLETIRRRLTLITKLGIKQVSAFMAILFKGMTARIEGLSVENYVDNVLEFSIDLNLYREPMHIYAAELKYMQGTMEYKSYNIPIRYDISYIAALRDSRRLVNMDPCLVVTDHLKSYAEQQEKDRYRMQIFGLSYLTDTSDISLSVYYLPKIRHPKDIPYDKELEFEESMYPEVITLASYYAAKTELTPENQVQTIIPEISNANS